MTSDLLVWPAAVPLLLLVPLAWIVLRSLDRARARRLVSLVGPRAPVVAAELGLRERRLRRWLALGALLAGLVALLQPQWGERVAVVEQRSADLLVCLDVSRSMLARDVEPSRLQAARRAIQALAERARGDRLGIVAFAGEARLTVPLTRDRRAFSDLVELVDPRSVRLGGTDLGAALEHALAALKERDGGPAAVLLITDGEDHGQRGLAVAAQCVEQNIVVHCIGFGSARGSKIAVAGDGGEAFLRDRAGDDVVSAMSPDSLREIAESTGGVFVEASRSPSPLVELYDSHIVAGARAAVEVEQRRQRVNRFQWPLLVAFVLWMLELCLTDRRMR